MDFNSLESINNEGFTGFKKTKELWLDKSCIPKERGVYFVLNPDYLNFSFINPGVGGFFKGKDPNVSETILLEKYIEDSQVVYIGKAGSPTGNATLNSRLGQYLRFGQTKNVGHWGGRYIWQLQNHAELIFCWKPTPNEDPRIVETYYINLFKNQFGTLPFANLTN